MECRLPHPHEHKADIDQLAHHGQDVRRPRDIDRLAHHGQDVRRPSWQALPSHSGGVWDTPPGRVGVLMRQGIPVRVVDLPWKADSDCLLMGLRWSCRWVHVLVGMGNGASILHLQGVCSHSGRPDDKNAFLDKVLAYTATFGNEPMVLVGNFGHSLDNLARVPPSVLMALLTRCLVDADKELAAERGLPCGCRFDGGANKRPTRIDGLLVSTRLAVALRDVRWIAESGIPGYTPAEFELTWSWWGSGWCGSSSRSPSHSPTATPICWRTWWTASWPI